MYTLIEHRKLTTAASTITFSSIPQTFTDLMFVTSIRGISYCGITLNSNNSNTSMRILWGTGSNAQSPSYTSFTYNIWQAVAKIGYTSNTFGNSSIYIPNYTTSTPKSVAIESVGENNGSSSEQIISSALWNNSAAVTSITFTSLDDNLNPSGNFAQNSSVTLYGINRTSAIGKPKALGGAITYANGYWVHTFTGSGTFSAQQNLEVDALVVAGGGAGGSAERGGGGGAGGLLTLSSRSLSAGAYSVLIGAGGAGHASSVTGTAGNDGSSSSFLTTSTIGGGGGGGGYSSSTGNGTAGRSGGSGGGGGIQATSGQYSLPGGSGTSGQGNNGGSSGHDHATYGKGGGGGGAGGVGASITANGQTGTGGIGMLWNGTYYAGGGGGAGDGTNGTGPGGLGGGGRAGFSGTPAGLAGTANTGGGGGAGWFNPNASSGSGGSGVVVIRYRAD